MHATPGATWETTDAQWPAPLKKEAYYGLAGTIVSAIEPHTEADPVAILLQLLVAVGNAAGRSPFFRAEADQHHVNLFAILVGQTAKGRKGSSWGHIRNLMAVADPKWNDQCICHGLSSGEGLIWAVRDPVYRAANPCAHGPHAFRPDIPVDQGVEDKRLLVMEGEFVRPLRALERNGNTLSAVIREAWDSGQLQVLTKNSPAKATGAHISIIGHVTQTDLLRYLSRTDTANGFANRFLFAVVRRSKVLPEGGNVDPEEMAALQRRLEECIAFAKTVTEMRRDADAKSLWYEVYPELSMDRPGLLGLVTSRAEAQVMRLACCYALLDRSPLIRVEHLSSALACWQYCYESCRVIFGNSVGDPVADQILEAVQRHPEGVSRTDLRDLFQRNVSSQKISQAIELLRSCHLVRVESYPTGGRAVQRVLAASPQPR
ncbi:hypothetical protein [Symbiobacterium terraclitae]|uniref:hypothetical protein n=1 Tax=Symbiobacterium terraclitae TaxID=557451 RepID=UPI0035B50736